MTSFNKVILLGNLTRDPEIRYTTGGKAVASFGLAVNKRTRGQDGTYENKVDYIDIIAFDKQAENCGKYLHQGDGALVEGRLNQRRWDDKETGAKRSKIEVNAQAVTFMAKSGRKPTGGDESRQEPNGIPDNIKNAFPDAEPAPPIEEDDIPF